MGHVVAVYLGSFDPITYGHLDIIERAAQMYAELIVGVGSNAHKQPSLSQEERIGLVRKCCHKWPHVKTEGFDGLAVHFARGHGAKVMIRGLRTEADFGYEMQMAVMNRILGAELETVFIPSNQTLNHISSSLVKEVSKFGGDISQLVPQPVLDALKHS